MLWDLAELVREQGFDWKGWFGGDKFPKKPVNAATLYTHGVNNGQAIKSEAVWCVREWETSLVYFSIWLQAYCVCCLLELN